MDVCGACAVQEVFALYKKWDCKLREVPKVVRGFVAFSEVVPRLIADGLVVYNA